MMTQDRLEEILAAFGSRKIVVVGDFFLDKYLEFDPSLAEISLETGKIANQVVNVRHSPGAAGTVVCNLAALGAGTIIPIGFTGDDGEGYDLRHNLKNLGCVMDHVLTASDRLTPTYLKPRDTSTIGLDGERERYNTKNHVPLPGDVESEIISRLREVVKDADAVIAMEPGGGGEAAGCLLPR